MWVTLVCLAASLSACGAKSSGAGSKVHQRASEVAATTSTVAPHFRTAAPGHFLGDEDDDDPSRTWNTENPSDKDLDFDKDSLDSAKTGYHDGDDSAILRLGHDASASDRNAIAAVVKRYYAAAAASDGKTACALTDSRFAATVPEDYAGGVGLRYLEGLKACPAVLAKLFQHLHATVVQPPTVTGVRVAGRRGWAFLGWASLPASVTEVAKERGAWKLDRVLSAQLP